MIQVITHEEWKKEIERVKRIVFQNLIDGKWLLEDCSAARKEARKVTDMLYEEEIPNDFAAKQIGLGKGIERFEIYLRKNNITMTQAKPYSSKTKNREDIAKQLQLKLCSRSSI